METCQTPDTTFRVSFQEKKKSPQNVYSLAKGYTQMVFESKGKRCKDKISAFFCFSSSNPSHTVFALLTLET